MSAQPVDLQIFWALITCQLPTRTKKMLLLASAAELEQRLQDLKERSGVSNTEHLIFIVALNMSHELAEEKLKTRDYAYNMEEKIKMLQQSIEQAFTHDQGKHHDRTFSTSK